LIQRLSVVAAGVLDRFAAVVSLVRLPALIALISQSANAFVAPAVTFRSLVAPLFARADGGRSSFNCRSGASRSILI
jgi:hypothetical protein